jgi:HPt (histidine-containing phosphotransfer) domain-containing protein
MSNARLDSQALTELHALLDDDFPGLIAIFIRDAQHQLERLMTAIPAQDASTVRMSAHTLKGSSGNIGCVELARLSDQMEEHAKAGRLDRCEALMPYLSLEAEWAFGQLDGLLANP